jgi:hypothetical protein
MTPMRAISVTICRDRRPDSPIAPLQPLPDEEWQRFRTGVLAAMEAISARETEIREGHTVWDGREEYCLTVSRTWVTATDEQVATLRAELAELAAAADQDAVVLHDEERHLVTAG